MENAEIIPSLSMEALIARREAALAALRKIRDAVAEFEANGETLKLGEDYGHHSRAGSKWTEPVCGGRSWEHAVNGLGWFEWASKNVDSALWEHLLALSGLRTFLDAEAKKDWDEAIEKNKTPELTAPVKACTARSWIRAPPNS
jgi:hypothetical protein